MKFHGNTKFETLYKHLLEADLDVLVSYGFDTFGMTLIEAEAVGVPVLICDPDLLEVIPEGGVAIAAGPSVGQMAEAITRLTEEPERIEEMSKVMASHREEVLMSRRIGGLLEVFEKVIKNNK